MIITSSKERLTKSALITVVFHLAAAAVLFSKPIHLNPRFFSQIGKTPSVFMEEENIAILKRNKALEEAFSSFEIPPLGTKLIHSEIANSQSLESGFETPPLLPQLALALPEFEEAPLPELAVPSFEQDAIVLIQPPVLSSFESSLPTPSFDPLPKRAPLNYELPAQPLTYTQEEMASFNYIPSLEASRMISLASPEMPSSHKVDGMVPSMQAPTLPETPSVSLAGIYADFAISPQSPRSITGIRPASSLSEYGLPLLELREWNEFFDVDVKTYPKEEGGFLFSINIIPRIDLSEHRLKQNYLFVIDRSGSGDKHRNQTAKRATLRAISSLRPGDFFNIVYLDSNAVHFSETSLPFNKGNEQLAEEFLEKQSNSSSNGSSDIYTALTKLIDPQVAPQESVTAILISDGGSSAKSVQQRKKINQWLEANRDRVTLHAATAGHGNNLSSLKMLSLASRGTLLYSDTHAAFPRKLAKLVMDLRYPIAKEMSVSIIRGSDESLELLPPSSRLPNLFSDHPYVLVGSTDKLTEFTLILEGKNKDQVFTIKKPISLAKAKQGSRLLLKQWSAEKAHTLFDQYLREGETAFLHQAEKQLGHDAQNSRR